MGVFKVKAVVLLPKLLYTYNCIHNHMLITHFLWLLWRKSLAIDIFMIVICNTRIAENVGGRKHWRIQLFGLFGEENFGEWPTNKIRILNIL